MFKSGYAVSIMQGKTDESKPDELSGAIDAVLVFASETCVQ
jgi:hypothetical protein